MAPQGPPAPASPFRLDMDLAALLQEPKTPITASLNWKVWKSVLAELVRAAGAEHGPQGEALTKYVHRESCCVPGLNAQPLRTREDGDLSFFTPPPLAWLLSQSTHCVSFLICGWDLMGPSPCSHY